VLSTERLIIRPFKKNDYRDTYEYMSAPETYKFERGAPVSLNDAKKQCRQFTGKTAPGFFAAELKENGKVIGHISFFPERPKEFRMWNIGYIFHPAYYGRGYATEATRAVIAYAFKELKVHRIVAHCSPDNIASWKIMEKCNMKREGLNRKDFLWRTDENGNSVWFDSYEYAIIEEDFSLQS
jgi:ribosomal-protein-alanine N-acetyltransferase